MTGLEWHREFGVSGLSDLDFRVADVRFYDP